MKQLREDIKKHSFRPVYLLYGEEAFLKRSFKKQLVEAIRGEDTMNYHEFYGTGIDVSEVISLADTMPFFAEKRLILIENSGFFKKESEKLTDYLPAMPESTVMIFVEEQADARGRFFKAVKKQGLCVNMERQSEEDLKNWIIRYLARNGRQITQTAVMLLLENVGDDMELLSHELDKLISYTEGSDAVYPEDVGEICSVQITGKIFDMITDIAARKQKDALDKYYDLLSLKEPPARIMALISRQYAQLLMVKELALKNKSKDEIAQKCGIKPFVAGKAMGQAKKYRMAALRAALEKCTEAEYSFKSGRMNDQMAVELLISELSAV